MSDTGLQRSENTGLFLLRQTFSRLDPQVNGRRRRVSVCGQGARGEDTGFEKRADPIEDWKPISRSEVAAMATMPGEKLRVALACDAGLGKSTNMQWLSSLVARTADCHQVPLVLRLDEADRPDGSRDQTTAMKVLSQEQTTPGALLNWWAGRLAHEHGCDQGAMKEYLVELQKKGQISLLIDGLDHALAHEDFFTTLRELVGESALWKHCPIWLAGRPYALHLCWGLLKLDGDWTFLKVNPLREPEIRKYLETVAGLDVYDQLSHSHDLLAVPRLLALVCAIVRGETQELDNESEKRSAFARCQLDCPADIYHRAYFEEDPPQVLPAESGLVTRPFGFFRQALVGEAETFGLDEGQRPSSRNVAKRIEAIGTLVGAIAFVMMDGRNADGQPRPILDGMRDQDLQNILKKNLRDFGLASEGQMEDRLSLLEKMNVHTCDFLLFSDGGKERWVFRDRTVQAFFAAYWVVKQGSPGQLQKIQDWRWDSQGKFLSYYDEFWQFVAQMPKSLAEDGKWVALLKPSYLHPHELKGSEGFIQWHRRSVYWSHYRMKALDSHKDSLGHGVFTAWRKGSKVLAEDWIRGWRRCPKDQALQGPQTFLMGSPTTEEGRFGDETQRWVSVEPSFLQEFVVTNAQYRCFDPSRKWEKGDARGNEMPVGVSFWDAACFAIWVGHRLPTEREWEYACRAGTSTAYFYGEKPDTKKMNYDEGKENSPNLKGQYPANEWGLFDMHGNVWEWCDSPFESGASDRVLRGGSWYDRGRSCRSAYRSGIDPSIRSNYCGFRLAAVPDVGARSGPV